MRLGALLGLQPTPLHKEPGPPTRLKDFIAQETMPMWNCGPAPLLPSVEDFVGDLGHNVPVAEGEALNGMLPVDETDYRDTYDFYDMKGLDQLNMPLVEAPVREEWDIETEYEAFPTQAAPPPPSPSHSSSSSVPPSSEQEEDTEHLLRPSSASSNPRSVRDYDRFQE